MHVHSESQNRAAAIPVYIDIDRSTSQMVVLRDVVNRSQHLVTLADLLVLIRTRPAATATG